MQTAQPLHARPAAPEASTPGPLTLSFDMPQVERWARFSSDRNPIHFDRAHARAAGLDALIVHGMLAMLPIKQAVSDAVAPARWMKFRSLLRNPIAHGQDIVFTARPADAGKAPGLTFRVSGSAGTVEHFRGAYVQVDDPAAGLEEGAAAFGAPLDASHLARFFESYPDVKPRWIALDAVVFSELMRSRLHDIERLAQAHMARLSGGAPAARVVVQSSHTVTFDAAFFDALAGAGADADVWTRLSIAFLTPELLASGNQVGGVVALPVLWKGRLVMLVEVGLVARFDARIPN